MKRTITVAVGLPLLLVLLMFLAGLLLPADHVAVARATIPAPPALVWARIVDFDAHESWRSTVRDVRRDGDTVTEIDRAGDALVLAIVEREEQRRLRLEVQGEGAFGGTWTIALVPHGDGTHVELTEAGEIRIPPVRVIARLGYDPTETARLWLSDLARSFGAEVEVTAELER